MKSTGNLHRPVFRQEFPLLRPAQLTRSERCFSPNEPGCIRRAAHVRPWDETPRLRLRSRRSVWNTQYIDVNRKDKHRFNLHSVYRLIDSGGRSLYQARLIISSSLHTENGMIRSRISIQFGLRSHPLSCVTADKENTAVEQDNTEAVSHRSLRPEDIESGTVGA